jgi:TctA family transporter
MFDAFTEGLFMVLQWRPFIYLLIGSFIGFWVGIRPGGRVRPSPS